MSFRCIFLKRVLSRIGCVEGSCDFSIASIYDIRNCRNSIVLSVLTSFSFRTLGRGRMFCVHRIPNMVSFWLPFSTTTEITMVSSSVVVSDDSSHVVSDSSRDLLSHTACVFLLFCKWWLTIS